MKSKKASTFLKGLKSRNHNQSEFRPSTRKAQGLCSRYPNSTKVGQGEGNIARPFDVSAKRSMQQKNMPKKTKRVYHEQ